VGEQFEPRNLESFDPVTQDLYRPAIGKLSALRTGLRTTAEIWNGASKTTSEINDKNWIKEKFISSQVFHRTPGARV
jgi:hypothetical protein